ncbi:hypothetical protein Hanom_Chr14g01276651 [Helianthus anomalus]
MCLSHKDKYARFLVEKYGNECSKDPKFDQDFWSRVGGNNRGKVYGLSNVSDPCVHSRKRRP